MKTPKRECIKKTGVCLDRDGKDYRLLTNKCCLDEIKEDQEIIQSVIDSIEDCSKTVSSLKRIASKLSYASNLINHNNEEDLLELIPLIKRYSMLIFEFHNTILINVEIGQLVYSFNIELQKWFQSRFLEKDSSTHNTLQKSILADIQTVEMSLGVCMIEYPEDDSLDDLFF